MARVLVLYTGGTIGMRPGPDGALAPDPDLLPWALGQLPELDPEQTPDPPEVDVLCLEPLVDSSDMTPARWVQIARTVSEHHDHHDGFVVVHGTDTLAYTASALSFFIESLTRPVVLTGAQLPFGVPRSDARHNLVTAIQVAAQMPASMAQVCIVFGSRILRGNRATKVSARGYEAFVSPRFPDLGRAGIELDFDTRLRLPSTLDRCAVLDAVPPLGAVAVLRLFPGFSGEILRAVCGSGNLRALVLEAYGAGNGPSRDADFLDAIREITEAGIVVLVVAQPLDGIVNLGNYAAGSALAQAGAISGRDITTEAALTKLHYAVARGLDARGIQDLLRRPLAGEMRH